jgi:hypothetical protein
VVVGAVAVLLLAVVLRVVVSGPAALDRGDAAYAQGDHLGACAAWREAVSWVLPLGASSLWREPAMERLESLADDRVEAGDLPGGVMALSSLRSGILAGHGLLRPDQDRVHGVDPMLAALLADWEAEDALAHDRTVPGDRPERVAFYEARLAEDPRPSRPMSALALAGFLLWVITMFRNAGAQAGSGGSRGWALALLGLGMMLTGVALA